VTVSVGIAMLQQATRLMAEEIPHDRWRDVTVEITESAVVMSRGLVSEFDYYNLNVYALRYGSTFLMAGII